MSEKKLKETDGFLKIQKNLKNKSMKDNIDIKERKNEKGAIKKVYVRFGPHYFVEIIKNGKKTLFKLAATHHGFKADASEVNGELEKIIYEIRKRYQKNQID